ncbi:MAG TPA: sialate O-acetylesterase [Kribbella sp.]|uniref:sialate O-acetylesterase n=1 Tax=Kribbella sp. TaxID=1871183 RepID=UPI002D7A044D|nr:sialate O-acetylesterase [Kribbella sp.]HET6296474.1 sialate O-acetylesterase [Kribbella sp.]
MPRFAPARALIHLTVLATIAVFGAVVSPASAVPTPAAAGCDTGAVGFTPVLQINLPTSANWLNTTPPYTLNRTAEIGSNFDRVGYCLELNGPKGPQWVWTAMAPFTSDAKRLGLQTFAGQLFRQQVGDLEVNSNVPGVTNGTGQTGYIEMWPNQYSGAASGQVPNASTTTYDADDSPTTVLGHGSFQIHQIGATKPSTIPAKPVLSVNRFSEGTAKVLGLGIGTNTTGAPDWTLTDNAASYTQRKLTVYARPALVTLTEMPQDLKLIPRDSENGANPAVAGQVTAAGVDQVELRVTGNGQTQTFTAPASAPFRFTPRIVAGLHEYTFELRATGPAINRVVARRDGIVSGDVYVVQGQSNAEAAKRSGNANVEESPYLRSFGSSNANSVISGADRVWHYATGDVTQQSGSVGQWAIRMGRRIVDTYGIPVALFNGSHGGQPISFFQRNDTTPNDLATNYGRLRSRLQASGVLSRVKGVLWYQGEAESDNASVHISGFTSLLQDWRTEIGTANTGGSKYFVYQVRTSPCGDTTKINLREAQRKLGDTQGVTILSANGLSGHDGCHYTYAGGYREMGDHTFAVLGRDLYGGPSAGVAPPNPSSVTKSGTTLTVKLRSTDALTVDSGAAANFRLVGSTVTVSSVVYQAGGTLKLTLSGTPTGATALVYQGHLGAGPWITNATGTGLLAFNVAIA